MSDTVSPHNDREQENPKNISNMGSHLSLSRYPS